MRCSSDRLLSAFRASGCSLTDKMRAVEALDDVASSTCAEPMTDGPMNVNLPFFVQFPCEGFFCVHFMGFPMTARPVKTKQMNLSTLRSALQCQHHAWPHTSKSALFGSHMSSLLYYSNMHWVLLKPTKMNAMTHGRKLPARQTFVESHGRKLPARQTFG
jgi:hypothetical protein